MISHPTRTLLLILLAACGCMGRGYAQQVAPEAERTAGVRFIFGRLTGDAPASLDMPLDGDGRRVATVPLSQRTPSGYLPMPAGREIRLGVMPTDPAKPFVCQAMEVRPEGAKRLLGILVPGTGAAGNGPRFQIKLVDEDLFRPGDFHFINLTPYEFGVSFDGSQFKIGGNTQETYHPKVLEEARNAAVMVSFRAGETAAWQVMTRSTWRLRPTRKELCLFQWDEENQRPALRGLTLFESNAEK